MPPKKNSAAAKAVAKAAAAAAPGDVGDFSLELRHGEVDRANADYLQAVEVALDTLKGHALFNNMVQEETRGITNTVADTGFQSVFDADLYNKAIASGTYTAGGNMFWVDLRWSATPGVPLRLQAVRTLASTLFQSPTPYPGALHIAVTPGYEPLLHRGAWNSVSPEELAHAMIFAVADAVRTEPDNIDRLNAWKRCLLSTTFTFKLLATAQQRTWYALQQRENVSAVHLVVHRSCFQRCHEVSRLRHRLLETMSSADVTPQMIYDAYQKNLTMVPGASGNVTLSFCDSASTIVQKLLEVPDIHAVLMGADSLQGLSVGCGVFDSHSRLQAILNKTGANVEHRIWVVEGLFYLMKTNKFDKEVSVADLRGSQRTSNKGLCDLLIYKHALKRQLFQREAPLRANDILINTDVPFTKWLENDIEPRMKTFKAWMQTEADGKLIWRAGRTPSEVRWLTFVEDITFGSLWDAPLKLLVKGGTLPADALNQGTLAEELSAIDVQHREEQSATQLAAVGLPQPADDHHATIADLTVDSVKTDGTRNRVEIRLGALSDERREVVLSSLQRARKNLAANVVLINKDNPDGLSAQLAQTALGQLRGNLDQANPTRSRYVGIFFDVKCGGEATHRPNLRIPPLQRGEASMKPLLEAARARLIPQLPSGEAAPDGSLDAGDIYFLLDGGMTGNVATMYKAFQSKEKVSKSFIVLKDVNSVDSRHERVRGVGNIRQTETLLIVSQNQITVPPVQYQTYSGGTYGDVIGPIVLTMPEHQWRANWSEKKRIFGPEQLIDVGGKLDVDAPDAKRKKARTDDTVEPVFFHSMPETFYTELLTAFNITGVIDCCAGEGTCALACYRKAIPYVGITFNTQHTARLMAHLEKVILGNMTTDSDPLYDVKFAEAVRSECAQPKPQPLPKPPTKPKKPAPTPANQPAKDPVGSEPAISGDEA